MIRKLFLLLAFAAMLLPGCATNPVTGSSELSLVSESREIEIGQQQYEPSRQMQGGDYVIDPDLTRYVNEIGQRLAAVSDRQLPYEFVVLNNSVPNAWALPGGKLAINRGLLLELNNEAELAAVLGHEIVHAAARHGAKNIERGMLLQGAVLAAGIAASGSNYGALAVGGAQLGAALISSKYGRDAERESDYYGMLYLSRAGYDPQAAVSLQETFLRLSKNKNPNWLTGLFASHPPSQERVDANRETARTLPPGGELFTERYQRHIAHLKKTKDAYTAHDEGRKALSKGNTRKAMSLAEKALEIEPREPLFHALRGDVYLSGKRYREALSNYNQSLERNNRFFYFYVQRGMTKDKLGDREGARRDLKKSILLLPTAKAYNALGKLALIEGDRKQAKMYFNAAAGSKSEAGQQASTSLIRLDIPDNPNNYLRVQTGLNQKGYLIARVANPTSLPVDKVRLLIQYRDARGKIHEITRKVPGPIGPGKAVRINTGLGPINQSSKLSELRAIIISAEAVQ